ncbi:hypothetical protein FDB55_12740 [Clostridium botulinum]|uniref:Uncharacterized protein n=3 Tax=Clostridium botulinum TaxID=1491 RepID=A0A846JPI8_CLOBO|nr:hypothetical protein ACP51_07750 [Clostridium botulinum]KOR65697.1 hypothetical protein ADT22_00300 [Clostridium botulinum]MCS6111339.1 hypothetical protein [Clostridium botulinum]NFL42568.1 hypothetical protein [Clostridium botulinum]NFN03489.1 hypothetical protein [Clostridium botulinum]
MWGPLLLCFIVPKLGLVLKYNFSVNMSLVVSLTTLTIMYISKTNSNIIDFYTKNYNFILTVLIIAFLISRIISANYKIENKDNQENEKESELFNLLYVNTSKVHEIAMLIDNKVMKTVEKEQISEELLKSSYSYGLKSNVATSDASIQKEENSKKRVYENFDVKTTKSIMLRKIYDQIKQDNNKQNRNLKTGQLFMFNEVALERRNVDDTVMALKVLQDSKIKNQGDENIEINMNKMMEKMLDDFTIDYVFEQKRKDNISNSKYIFQLPYKSNENFENGYQHNDLQLGTLSLIGIYRGEIDFSKRESVSSKFLEIMSDSYNNSKNTQSNEVMKTSIVQAGQQLLPFEFKHNKLNEKYHLIDIIAIIQELNIEGY